MDDQVDWEERMISSEIKTDLLTSIINFMVWGPVDGNALSSVFMHKQAERRDDGERRPEYVVNEIEYNILPLSEKEKEDYISK